MRRNSARGYDAIGRRLRHRLPRCWMGTKTRVESWDIDMVHGAVSGVWHGRLVVHFGERASNRKGCHVGEIGLLRVESVGCASRKGRLGMGKAELRLS